MRLSGPARLLVGAALFTGCTAAPGSHPHDVAPAADGGVWYTAQHTGRLGWLDPATGDVREMPLRQPAEVRQLLGRPGEVWGAESAADRLVVIRTLP